MLLQLQVGGQTLKEKRGDQARPVGLRNLLDFAVPDARRADPDTLAGALDESAHGLKIDIPATLGNVMCVADAIPKLRAAAT